MKKGITKDVKVIPSHYIALNPVWEDIMRVASMEDEKITQVLDTVKNWLRQFAHAPSNGVQIDIVYSKDEDDMLDADEMQKMALSFIYQELTENGIIKEE